METSQIFGGVSSHSDFNHYLKLKKESLFLKNGDYEGFDGKNPCWFSSRLIRIRIRIVVEIYN